MSSRQVIARGQTTIYIQKDSYTISQSLGEYVFPADHSGKVLSAVSLTSTIKVTCGDSEYKDFTIGVIVKPAGFSSISVDNSRKTVTYTVATGTTTLAEHGSLDIPVTIAGAVYSLSFVWSKAKAGAPGTAGADANLLDWVREWNTGKTLIDSHTVITPKLFAGVKNADGTVTGTAIGRFSLSTKTASGGIATETIDGICGFRNGSKTFLLDNGGNVQLGYGDQFVRYDALTGKITFGAGVSLNWTNAIQQAKTETLNAAAATAQSKADAALGSAKSYADTKKSEAVTQAGKDADGKISALTATLNTSIADAKKAGTDARAVADAITSKANAEGWSNKLTYIDANGIFTGKLSANTVNAININASQITAGTIATARLNAAEIRSNIINAAYINGLTCAFVRGTIGGWTIGATTLSNSHILLDSGNKRVVVYGASSGATSGKRVQIYYNSDTDFGFYATDAAGNCLARFGSANQIAGWNIDANRIYKNNIALGADGSIMNGSKWKLNNDGSGSIASGNISWDAAGAVTFSAAVSLNWKNDIEAAKRANFGYPYYHKIVIYGEEDKYYPVIFKGGDQTFKRDILIRRAYSEQAPDSWNNTTHKGGLVLLLKANFGGWGGIGYSWDIYELSETYCRMFAGAQLCGNCCMFAVFLRGGGTTGAVYHIYSDQPIVNNIYSPSPIPAAPQIAYNCDLIFQSGSNTANAPGARTLTATVQEEIRRHRFIALAQSSDSTLAAHPLTYIGSTGIYTGTLTAAQVNAVSIDAGSIRTGTLSADRLGCRQHQFHKTGCRQHQGQYHQYGLYQRPDLYFRAGQNRWLDHRRGQHHGRQCGCSRSHANPDADCGQRFRLLVQRRIQTAGHRNDMVPKQQCGACGFRSDCRFGQQRENRFSRHPDDDMGPCGILLSVGQLHQIGSQRDLQPHCRMGIRQHPHLEKQRLVGCRRLHHQRYALETQQRRFRLVRFRPEHLQHGRFGTGSQRQIQMGCRRQHHRPRRQIQGCDHPRHHP